MIDARTGPRCYLGDERLAVGVVDADHGDGRLAAERLGGGRAPDRRADALVHVLPGVDEDLADGAATLERADRRRHRVALGEDDPAAHRIVAAAGARGVGQVEEAGGAAGVLRRHIDRSRRSTASSPVARAIAGGRAWSTRAPVAPAIDSSARTGLLM